ncbi:hypothetical protein [Nostoc sp.]
MVGEPARMSPALQEGFPPQVTGVSYGDLYSYGEASYAQRLRQEKQLR